MAGSFSVVLHLVSFRKVSSHSAVSQELISGVIPIIFIIHFWISKKADLIFETSLSVV